MLPRMPPLCKIAAPQMTFVKFLKGPGSPRLHQMHFESWVHSEAAVGGHLLVFWETTKFNSSSSFMIFSCYFRMWNVCCVPLFFCSEQDLPRVLTNSPATPGLSSFNILVFFKSLWPLPGSCLCPLYSFLLNRLMHLYDLSRSSVR